MSSAFDDVYFSTNNGIEETRHVFIQNNELEQRFSGLHERETFTIAETGFGSGLNFLCAWLAWEKMVKTDAKLHFISVEKFPLSPEDLQKALNLWPELATKANLLTQQYPPVDARGFHRLKFGNSVSLTLIYDDAEHGLNQLLPIDTVGPKVRSEGFGWVEHKPFIGLVDAWFLDGFAPSKNPEMWTSKLFKTIAQLSYTGSKRTTLATFTSAGIVRRGLIEAGFAIEKTPGFGKKREMLKGVFTGLPPSVQVQAHPYKIKADPSWHLCKANNSNPDTITVIGAGLAGCHSAFSLAQSGFKVTVIEQNQTGTGASGNPQGMLYSKLSQAQGVFTDFNLAAYLYASHFYEQNGFFSTEGSNCGVLQLAETAQQAENYQIIANNYPNSANLVRWLDASSASKKANIKLRFGGLWLPHAGWLNPPELCQALTRHSNIRVLEQRSAQKLTHDGKQWLVEDSQNNLISAADSVIIACAYSAKRFEQCQYLPTKAIRGQISLTEESTTSKNLTSVLCGTGYIAPSQNGIHCLGATFDLKSNAQEISQRDHQINLGNIKKMSTDFADLLEPHLEHGRVSFRCTTPDYLPIVGPVANENPMLTRFSAYRNNFKQVIDQPGDYWPGLYLNVGHGSKGLTYTPLCAELLTCMLTGEPPPLPRDLITHLHASRFLMRDLARNRL